MGSSGWVQRRWAAGAIRIGVFLAPSVAALAVGYGLSLVLGGRSLLVRLLTAVALVVGAALAHLVVARLVRRLLPLAALLRLALVFPDRAPSRMAVALRANQAQHLRRRIEAGEAAREDPPGQVAADLLAIVAFLTAHDRRTRGHAERVRAYSDLIAREMGLSVAERARLAWAALLHDVGKIGVPAEVLNKPGRLTPDELGLVRRHPAMGHLLVAPLAEWLGPFARVPLEHHEFFDGSGYPRGLAGLDISLPARIVSVADAFDVMTSTRAYRRAGVAAAAREELVRCAGTQFDPAVVRAFLNAGVGAEEGRGAAVSGALSPGWLGLRWSAAARELTTRLGAGLGILTVGGAAVLQPLAGGAPAPAPVAISVPTTAPTTGAPESGPGEEPGVAEPGGPSRSDDAPGPGDAPGGAGWTAGRPLLPVGRPGPTVDIDVSIPPATPVAAVDVDLVAGAVGLAVRAAVAAAIPPPSSILALAEGLLGGQVPPTSVPDPAVAATANGNATLTPGAPPAATVSASASVTPAPTDHPAAAITADVGVDPAAAAQLVADATATVVDAVAEPFGAVQQLLTPPPAPAAENAAELPLVGSLGRRQPDG